MRTIGLLCFGWMFWVFANDVQGQNSNDPIWVRDNFANGTLGWSVDFADYPVGEEEFYELAMDMERLPQYLEAGRFALKLTGNNHSDDLCMFARKRVVGLKPNTDYRVEIQVILASNASEDAIGIGGAPGKGVTFKVGVTLEKPVSDPILRQLSIDKGNQANGGRNAQVLGHIGVPTPAVSQQYRFKKLDNSVKPFRFQTDNTGEGWLFICTDSGFEGLTSLYVVSYSAKFVPLGPAR